MVRKLSVVLLASVLALSCATSNPDDPNAKAKRGDVPWRETGPESQASHHDPSGPDRDGCEAVEGTADIFRHRASTDGEIRHYHLRQQWTGRNPFSIF